MVDICIPMAYESLPNQKSCGKIAVFTIWHVEKKMINTTVGGGGKTFISFPPLIHFPGTTA